MVCSPFNRLKLHWHHKASHLTRKSTVILHPVALQAQSLGGDIAGEDGPLRNEDDAKDSTGNQRDCV